MLETDAAAREVALAPLIGYLLQGIHLLKLQFTELVDEDIPDEDIASLAAERFIEQASLILYILDISTTDAEEIAEILNEFRHYIEDESNTLSWLAIRLINLLRCRLSKKNCWSLKLFSFPQSERKTFIC